MVLINHQHERLQTMLGLKALLSGLAFLFSFFFQNGELGGVGLLLFIYLDLGGDEV